MRKKRLNFNKHDIVPVIIIIVLIGILAFLGITLYSYRDVIKNAFSKNTPVAEEEPADIPDLPYVTETRYIGGIGYPEVYEIPFQKSDIYKSNKKLWQDHPERVPEIVDTAKEFMSHTLNVNYKDIIDSSDYTNTMMSYMDKYWMYEEGNEKANDGIGYFCDEYVNMWKERLIDNELIIESEFLTDTSLVYVDGLYYVRGILVYTVFSSKDNEIPPTEGKVASMVEVALHLKTDDNGFEVVYVLPVNTPSDMVLTPVH